jgi:hypothetical protein
MLDIIYVLTIIIGVVDPLDHVAIKIRLRIPLVERYILLVLASHPFLKS